MSENNNDDEKKNGNALAVIGAADAFADLADKVSPKFIQGELLRFTKGDYIAGEKDEIIPLGTKMVVAMDSLQQGWVRWENGKPVEHHMVLVKNGEPIKRRTELGYDDRSAWDKDSGGEPRDPWQITYYLPMMDETMQVFTFTTTSRGGANAIGGVCRSYSRSLQAHAKEFPVIELQCNSYEHSKREFGRIKYPEF